MLLVRRVGALCCKAGIPPPLNTKVQSVAASQADLTGLCQQPQTTASRQSCVLPGTHCAGHHTVHKVTEGLLGRSHMAIRQTLNQRMQGRQLLAGCCCHLRVSQCQTWCKQIWHARTQACVSHMFGCLCHI